MIIGGQRNGLLRPRWSGPLLSSAAPLPTLANAYLVEAGDSRVASAGGYQMSGTGATGSGVTSGSNALGLLTPALGNRLIHRRGHNYGVGSITTRNLEIRARFNSISGTGNPAQDGISGQFPGTNMAVNVDRPMSTSSDRTYAYNLDPAGIGFYLCGVNDGGAYYSDPSVTFTSAGRHFDDKLAGSPNSVVYVLDGLPRGSAYVDARARTTSAAAGGLCTASVSDTGTGFIDGESFLANGASANVVGAFNASGAPLTKVANTALITDRTKYSVSGTTYTFHADLAAQTVYLTYDWANTNTTNVNISQRDWFRSLSPAPFTDTLGNTYTGKSGALYGRPRLRPVASWNALARTPDGTVAKPGCLDSSTANGGAGSLHPSPYGMYLICYKAAKPAFEADYGMMPSKNLPALGPHAYIGVHGGFTATKTYSGSLPAAFQAIPNFHKLVNVHYYRTSNNHQIRFLNDGTGNLILQASDNSAGDIDAVNYQSFTVSPDGTFTITGLNGNFMPGGGLFADIGETTGLYGGNLIINPWFDTDLKEYCKSASNFNVGQGGTLPAGVTGVVVGGMKVTVSQSLLDAIAAGTATIDVRPVPVGGGKNKLVVQMAGIASAAGSVSIAQGATANDPLPFTSGKVPMGSLVRAGVTRSLRPGPNGKTYGLIGFGTISCQIGVSSTTAPSNATTFSATTEYDGVDTPLDSNCTVMSALAGAGVTAHPWNDLIVADAGGVYTDTMITPPIITSGASIGTTTWTMSVSVDANRPFSFTVELTDPWMRVVSE